MTQKADYQKGYAAGKRNSAKRIKELEKTVALLRVKHTEAQERIFMRCLEMTLRECDNWTIGKKKVNNAEAYCQLAKAFADNAIDKLSHH